MNSRERQALDRYITGNYGEDQFKDERDPGLCPEDIEYFEEDFDVENVKVSGHAMAFCMSPMSDVYEYDPAENGPECEVITQILARHPLYIPGRERSSLQETRLLDAESLKLYHKRYAKLGAYGREKVRCRVVRQVLCSK